MKIIRAKRQKNFTVMANNVIYDVRLSYRALGLLTFLLSKPDGWETDSDRLSEGRKEGRDAVRTAMNELKKAGYLKQIRTQDPGTGRWSTGAELTDQPEDGFPVLGVTIGNTPSSQVGPRTGKPTVGYPVVGKPGPKASTDTKDGDQELETGGAPPPDPRGHEHAPRTRNDQHDPLTAVPDLNGTKQVTSKTRARGSPNGAHQMPMLSVIVGGEPSHPVDEYQLTLSVPIPMPAPLDPEREALWPVIAEQFARINGGRPA